MRTNTILFLERFANACEALAIIVILVMASTLQFVFHELPCPLCLLQRIGFYFMIFGFFLNLRFGFRPNHYAIIILGGLYTAFVAMRQISLHVVPGTGAYGDPIFGFHLYTWVFIIAMMIVVMTTFLFGIDRQYVPYIPQRKANAITHILFALVVITLMINIVSVTLQCGIEECPDNPETYKLLH